MIDEKLREIARKAFWDGLPCVYGADECIDEAIEAYEQAKGDDSARKILKHAYDYAVERDLNDGKYLERAIYMALSNMGAGTALQKGLKGTAAGKGFDSPSPAKATEQGLKDLAGDEYAKLAKMPVIIKRYPINESAKATEQRAVKDDIERVAYALRDFFRSNIESESYADGDFLKGDYYIQIGSQEFDAMELAKALQPPAAPIEG